MVRTSTQWEINRWLFLGLVKPETQKQAIMVSGMLFSVNGKHVSLALNLYIMTAVMPGLGLQLGPESVYIMTAVVPGLVAAAWP